MPDKSQPKVIKPLIKWTGGKYNEFPVFAAYIPAFHNYYEPFFGGGGVFFALRPRQNSFINDKSKDLVDFYRSLTSPAFKDNLYHLVDIWESLGQLNTAFADKYRDYFRSFIADSCDLDVLREFVVSEFSNTKKISLDVSSFPWIDKKMLMAFFQDSVLDKSKRIKHISIRENRLFAENEMNDHIETALRSGFYLYMRSLMNVGVVDVAAKTAIWYFVREFCYGSMFRFNAKGEFNIPYGGIAYNKKNFRTKVEALFRDEVRGLFQQTAIYNLDFERFLEETRPAEEDFIFLDPPYDSEFSEYDQNAFTRQDQMRLRDVLARQKAKWMVVIKETAFIRGLYEEIGAHFIDFDKTYLYNVRGRNVRETKHLIITNYRPL